MTVTNMLRGRQVVATLTNQSGGAVIAGDVVIVSAANDESFTTTTTAAYIATRVGVALDSIAAGAAGRILLEGYAPLVNVSASATRGHYLFTHTVAKQATSSASYAIGAFGQILKAGTTPSAQIFPVAQVGSSGVTRSGSTTDNHFAMWNGSNADSLKDGGAVTGNVTTTSAHASPPSTPASGDVWYPNDSFYVLRYSGAAQVPWGPIYPMTTPPAVSGLTWVNQETATVVETNGGIVMVDPAHAGDDCRMLVASAPGSTPWTFTVFMSSIILTSNNISAGICARQSSDGKFVTNWLVSSAGTLLITSSKWSDTSTVSAAYYTQQVYSAPRWFRITDTGANRVSSISEDGVNFMVMHTIGRTDFLTANQIGIIVNNKTATAFTLNASFLSWAVT